MDNKKLLLTFLVLLGIYAASKLFSGQKDRSFEADLIQIDSAAVNKVVLQTKADQYEPVTLQKDNEQWLISKGNFTTKATPAAVMGLLSNLSLIKAKRIVAKSPGKWAEYEVEDGKASRVQVYENGKLKEDFLLGRFHFDQQTRSATSYIRLHGENEVYAIDGFATMSVGQGFDSYRNKSIAKLNKDDITSVEWTDPAAGTTLLTKDGTQWKLGEVLADSALVATFLRGFTNMTGSAFVNDFDELKAAKLLHQKVTLRANNQAEPLTIHCYEDKTRPQPFVLHSSQNPDAYFASDSTGVYARLFKKATEFVK